MSLLTCTDWAIERCQSKENANRPLSCFLSILTNSWAGISATYGGLCVAARVLRGGTEDDWNVVLGTMAAGAMFARKGERQATIVGKHGCVLLLAAVPYRMDRSLFFSLFFPWLQTALRP